MFRITIVMDFPMILLLGQSGSGKSYALRNLPRQTTAVFNLESKFLPFKDPLGFKFNYTPPGELNKDCVDFEEKLDKVIASPEFEVIVIDSFTKYVERLLGLSKEINKGYDIYNYYNARIGKFLEKIKRNKNKFVILTGIDERVEFINPTGAITTSRRCYVSGKEWEGKIEKEFTVVLFTDVKQDKAKKVADYSFITNNDGTNSAKSPPDMFSGQLIENDMNKVVEAVKKFYTLDRQPRPVEDKITNQIPPLSTYVTA